MNDNETKEQELTVEQAEEKALEAASRHSAKLKSESDELRDLLFRRAAQDEVSRCCKFKGMTGAQVLEQIAKERNIKFSYSDTFDTILSTPGYNTVSEILEFAERHPDLADQRTLPKDSGDGDAKPKAAKGPQSKADLKTVKEKSDYITKFGGDAFNKLPAQPISIQTNPDKIGSMAEWRALPLSVRSRIVAERGSVVITEIARRENQAKRGW